MNMETQTLEIPNGRVTVRCIQRMTEARWEIQIVGGIRNGIPIPYRPDNDDSYATKDAALAAARKWVTRL